MRQKHARSMKAAVNVSRDMITAHEHRIIVIRKNNIMHDNLMCLEFQNVSCVMVFSNANRNIYICIYICIYTYMHIIYICAYMQPTIKRRRIKKIDKPTRRQLSRATSQKLRNTPRNDTYKMVPQKSESRAHAKSPVEKLCLQECNTTYISIKFYLGFQVQLVHSYIHV